MTEPTGSPTGEPAPQEPPPASADQAPTTPAPASETPGAPPAPAAPAAAPAAPPAAVATTPAATPIPPAADSAPPYWQSAPGPEGPAPGVYFADYGARIVAYIIDVILIGVVVGILMFVGILFSGGGNSGIVFTIMVGFSILVPLVYFPFFWQRDGQTPGMGVFGIRVVRDKDGGKVGWGSAILRLIGFTIDSIIFGLPIGYLWAFVDKRRRCWHDLIGGTVVIKA
jgi:uncharacterized RDD family membrane protein YckC